MREQLVGLFNSMQDLTFTKELQDKYHALIQKTEIEAAKLVKKMTKLEVHFTELKGRCAEQDVQIKDLLQINVDLVAEK